MHQIKYGVWNGVMYDNSNGENAQPEGLPLREMMNFNPGNPIDAIIGSSDFLVLTTLSALQEFSIAITLESTRISCGRCTPCRTGAILIELALKDAIEGRGLRSTGTISLSLLSR